MQVSKRKSNLAKGVNSFQEKQAEELLAKIKKKKLSEEDDVASIGREVIQGHDYVDDSVDEENVTEKKRNNRQVSHGFHMVRGKMGHGMEDYVIAETKNVDSKELGLYAIFDGHSGRDVAKYLQENLFNSILSEDEFWSNPESAVKKSYKRMNEEILDKVVGSRGGSTAVTAILIDRSQLVVANVGDSRGILCKRRVVEQLTVDHEPELEKELVERRGGYVSKIPGNVPRVDGQLAMTRAFGDGKLKEHITSEPDVRVEMIDDDTKFIVLASDGIWKVMSNEDVSDFVEDEEDAEEAAEELVKMALMRGSQDDISCVVVMVN